MIVRLDNVSKTYEATRALNGITLHVEAGGVVGVLGPNGAGKTTLVETIEGLRYPTAGRVSVLGLDPTRRARALKERLGVQLQSPALPEELTPLETLRLFASFFRRSLPPATILERVGLAGQRRVANGALSGGQQRRLAIGIALVNDPELLILDEPTSGLDTVARRAILDQIRELRSSERTVILTTHSIEEAEMLCDRVIILRAGEVVADGSPFELVSRARGPSVLWLAVEGAFDPTPLLRAGAVEHGREHEYHRFATPDPASAIVALAEMLRAGEMNLLDLRMKRPSLEDVYLDLVGHRASAPGEVA